MRLFTAERRKRYTCSRTWKHLIEIKKRFLKKSVHFSIVKIIILCFTTFFITIKLNGVFIFCSRNERKFLTKEFKECFYLFFLLNQGLPNYSKDTRSLRPRIFSLVFAERTTEVSKAKCYTSFVVNMNQESPTPAHCT